MRRFFILIFRKDVFNMPVSKAFDDAMKAGKIQLSLKGHLACLRYDLKNVGIDLGYIAKYFKEKISR